MKKYFIILGICILTTSCKKDLLVEDPQVPTGASFYNNANDLALASTGLYALNNVAFNQIAGWATCYGADDATALRGGNKLSFSDFDTFQANSSNDRMTNWWVSFYATIKSCNSLILNYGKADATETEKNDAAGQAYFLRALSYFFLTRVWGAIPLTTDNAVDFSRPKTQPADVYALIVADLQKAETMLPDTWNGTLGFQNGVNVSPTAGSAKALLANVYLTMAGWPLKQTDNYAKAAAKAKEVIDNKSTYSVDLLSDVANLWKVSYQYNNEAVFACYFNNAVPSAPWNQGDMLGPLSSQPGDEGGWDDWFGEIKFYNAFPAGPRKDATYQSVYYVGGVPKDWHATTLKHPYFQKMRDDQSYDPATHVASNWWSSRTCYIIRYAETLLTYAEAEAMSASPDAQAYAAINAVRERAGTGDLVAGLSQADFRDSVVAERGWEFAGLEAAARWFDLQRTETVGKANENKDPGDEPVKNMPNDQTHTYYWAPIPINDATLNPGLGN